MLSTTWNDTFIVLYILDNWARKTRLNIALKSHLLGVAEWRLIVCFRFILRGNSHLNVYSRCGINHQVTQISCVIIGALSGWDCPLQCHLTSQCRNGNCCQQNRTCDLNWSSDCYTASRLWPDQLIMTGHTNVSYHVLLYANSRQYASENNKTKVLILYEKYGAEIWRTNIAIALIVKRC